MNKTDNERTSQWIWRVDLTLIICEIIFAAIVYALYGGFAYLAFGHDSIGELVSNLVVLFYLGNVIKHKDSHKHAGTIPHEHEFHAREGKASQYVAFVFFGLALSTLIWPLLTGAEPTPSTVIWPTVMLGVFTLTTGTMGFLKWKQSRDKHDPRWAEALQSIFCVLSGVVAAAAGMLEHRISQSHLYGDIVIAVLMFVAGCMIINNKKLCC